MSESEVQDTELPLESVGTRLSNARRSAGLSRADVAARTKIAERHLISIEEDRLSDLAGKTYAVGFSRAFARAVGIDEVEIAQAVRDQLAYLEGSEERPRVDAFEPGDPARVPPSRIAWVSVLGALAVIVLVLIFWRSFLSPAGTLPDLTNEQETAPLASAEPNGPETATAARGPVIFRALEPNVWVKFYDAAGNQLMQKQMAQGESYTVPADAEDPQIWTARPDVLEITVGGRLVPRLAEVPLTIKDRPVSAAALLARASTESSGAGATPSAPTPRDQVAEPTPGQTSSPAPAPSPTAGTEEGQVATRAAATAPAARTSPRPSPTPTATPRPTPSPTRTPSPASAESAQARATPSPAADTDGDEPSTDSE